MVNPNSFRPYHTTLGPAAGPTCSKILAPPLLRSRTGSEDYNLSYRSSLQVKCNPTLEEAAQGKPSAKYRPTRVVVDAAFYQWIQHIFLVVTEHEKFFSEKIFLFDAL